MALTSRIGRPRRQAARPTPAKPVFAEDDASPRRHFGPAPPRMNAESDQEWPACDGREFPYITHNPYVIQLEGASKKASALSTLSTCAKLSGNLTIIS